MSVRMTNWLRMHVIVCCIGIITLIITVLCQRAGINLTAAAIANNPSAIQNAITAITGGSSAPPGLKNAYITAVQQVGNVLLTSYDLSDFGHFLLWHS